MILTKTANFFPLKQRLEEKNQKSGETAERENKIRKTVFDEKLPVVELYADSYDTELVEFRKNSQIYEKEAMDFVETLSEEELIDLAAGDPGKAQGGNLGAAGISVPGSAGETHRCAVDKGLASIVLADGPAGLRLMKYYHVDNGQIISMPFEFSLEGGLFYDNTKELPGRKILSVLYSDSGRNSSCTDLGSAAAPESRSYDRSRDESFRCDSVAGTRDEYSQKSALWKKLRVLFRGPVDVAGTIAAAMTNGVQSNYGCGTTIKHFACNNQEDNRMGSDSVVSERTLREIYLKGFEIAVKESQPLSIMTSYNLINGVHAANNYDLCTEIARNEWGFRGMIMTDWTTTEVDDSCTAAGCMRAGNDLVMPGCVGDHENLKKELADGTLKRADLKACIARLVSVIWRSNQYE